MGLWLLRAFQVKVAQVCTSEVVYTFIRGVKGQEKLRITCIPINFHTTKFHAGFFSEHIEEKIRELCSP